MKFIEAADQLRILILILPPHSTYQLQPLDVSLFALLARAYTNELNNLLFMSSGLISMSKRMFYGMFKVAFQNSFTKSNIASGFSKTGIWPLNPGVVMSIFHTSKALIPALPVLKPKTLLTCHAVRRAQREYEKEPCRKNLELIFQAASRLAADNSIQRHINQGLRAAIQLEKKKQQRSKKLNLIGEEDVGAQVFTPLQVRRAQEYQASKDDTEEARKVQIAEKKAAAAALREQKATEKAVRKQQQADTSIVQAAAKQLARESQAQKVLQRKIRKEAQALLKEQQKAERLLAKSLRKGQKSVRKPVQTVVDRIEEVVVEAPVISAISGRLVQRPKKLNE